MAPLIRGTTDTGSPIDLDPINVAALPLLQTLNGTEKLVALNAANEPIAVSSKIIPKVTRSADPPPNPQPLDTWEMTDDWGLTLLHTWKWIPGNETVPGKWVSKDTHFYRRNNIFLQDTTTPLPNESFVLPFPEPRIAAKKVSTFLKKLEIHLTPFSKAQDANNYYEFQIFTTPQGGAATYGSSANMFNIGLGSTLINETGIFIEADYLGIADWNSITPKPAVQKMQQIYMQVARRGTPGVVIASVNLLYWFQYYP